MPSTTPQPLLPRRRFLQLAAGTGLAVGAGGLLAACGSDGSPKAEAKGTGTGAKASHGTLKVGYLPITDAAPLLVAHADGTFADHGIDSPEPTVFRSWSGIAEAFQAKKVDVVHLLMPMVVQLRFDQKLPVKVLSWNHTNGSALTVAPDVDEVTDLAGTTVAVPFWFSIHNVVLQQLFRDQGLTPIIDGSASAADRTVKLVVMGPPDMPPALANGSIAGYIVADPFNAMAEISGVGKILRFTGDVWRDHACCVTVVHEDLITGEPEAAQALVDSVAQAQLALRDDAKGNAKLLHDGGYLPQALPAIERALTHYDTHEYEPLGAIQHPEWGSKRIDYQPYAFPSYTEALISALRETVVDGNRAFLDDIDLGTAHEQLVAVGLAQKAIENNGGFAAFGLDGPTRREDIAP